MWTICYQFNYLILENEDILTKFATRADALLKGTKKNEDGSAPEELFSLTLLEDSSASKGKRKPKPTEKRKESVEQEESFSPKKRKGDKTKEKVNIVSTDSSSPKKKKVEKNVAASSDGPKKRIENTKEKSGTC